MEWGRAAVWGALAGLVWVSEAHAEWSSLSAGGASGQLYAPASMSPIGEGRALMVVLHGCAQTALDLRSGANLEPAAEDFGVVMAVPDVPGGGVIAGCWDYYGASHAADAGHPAAVLSVVDALLGDAALQIDPQQVYVVGFSSGGGEALVLGCVAPEVFAGVGLVAAPGLGTEATEIGTVSTTGAAAAEVCLSLAGSGADALSGQVAFTFADAADTTVAPGYNPVNTQMFGTALSDGLEAMMEETSDVSGAALTTYADEQGVRVGQLDSSAGLGHVWPSGSGESPGSPFISAAGPSMAAFATEFFAEHNLRVEGGSSGTTSGGDESGSASGADSDSGADAESGETDADASGTSGEGSAGSGGDSAGGTGGGEEGDADAGAATRSSGGCRVSEPPPVVLFGLLALGVHRRRRRGGPVRTDRPA